MSTHPRDLTSVRSLTFRNGSDQAEAWSQKAAP